MACLGTAPCCY